MGRRPQPVALGSQSCSELLRDVSRASPSQEEGAQRWILPDLGLISSHLFPEPQFPFQEMDCCQS